MKYINFTKLERSNLHNELHTMQFLINVMVCISFCKTNSLSAKVVYNYFKLQTIPMSIGPTNNCS